MLRTVLAITLVLFAPIGAAADSLPDLKVVRGWIEEMKTSDRGPFARIRWYCKDGQILPPEPSACKPYGGGVQHGEWTDRVKLLRRNGFWIANIYADLDLESFRKQSDYGDAFKQMVIEQFLINVDDGWILHKARYYRGAFQAEDEVEGTRKLLTALAADPVWVTRDFLVLRTGAALLPHGHDTKSVKAVRQKSTELVSRDPGFLKIKNKIHARPDPKDAQAVRDYAGTVSNPALKTDLEDLAAAIDAVYQGASTSAELEALATRLKNHSGLAEAARQTRDALTSGDAAVRFAATARFMALVRDHITEVSDPALRLALLDASLAVESEHYAAGASLREGLAAASRHTQIGWLSSAALAAYGAGLISPRQRDALTKTAAGMGTDTVLLTDYKAALDYLALLPAWGTQQLRLHFGAAVDKLAPIEPVAVLFPQDQVRSGPLFFYAQTIDGLLRDANRLAGVKNELFGEDVGAGLRGLNPGLARGVLLVAEGDIEHESFRADGIYLLPETVADLPPVAGILTQGEGNPLSHVQLLARNLGIPNVAVDASLSGRLAALAGKRVVLAVSPGGSVRLAEDGPQWDPVFGATEKVAGVVITPDLEKLDLARRDFIPLDDLRADDSGRVVGPKAAKLGELKHHYPETVAPGLAIPFGAFRALLDQPMPGTAGSVFDWMVAEYRKFDAMPAGSDAKRVAIEEFRERLETWVRTADPGPAFRDALRQAMQKQFGADGSYGVFVRSDTNVEDLAGFTGAGLNLTVPNVVGFDNVVKAISEVWASPFSARSFSWRQSRMTAPEHVYPAVLLLRSVPNEKSGVLVTRDVDTGNPDWLSVAVNEGVGGAVDGQAAESLRINTANGEVRVMSDATAPVRRVISPKGGVDKVPVSGAEAVLQPGEAAQLVTLARELPQRFPPITDAQGRPAPADIEFGFIGGRLQLFQIRPFLESERARASDFLNSLDAGWREVSGKSVSLAEVPTGGGS